MRVRSKERHWIGTYRFRVPCLLMGVKISKILVLPFLCKALILVEVDLGESRELNPLDQQRKRDKRLFRSNLFESRRMVQRACCSLVMGTVGRLRREFDGGLMSPTVLAAWEGLRPGETHGELINPTALTAWGELRPGEHWESIGFSRRELCKLTVRTSATHVIVASWEGYWPSSTDSRSGDGVLCATCGFGRRRS